MLVSLQVGRFHTPTELRPSACGFAPGRAVVSLLIREANREAYYDDKPETMTEPFASLCAFLRHKPGAPDALCLALNAAIC